MKIWIDFINTPQVNFFEMLIEDLVKEGHEFVLTCRDSSNTVNLLNQKGWEFKIIGNKVYKSSISKILAFPIRVFKLQSFLRNKNIDVAIGQSSFYLPITASLLGIKSIYTNDNEHAKGNIPSFYFAQKILLPENLSLEKVKRQGAKPAKTIFYPGIKEGVYLWKKGQNINKKRTEKKAQTIYVRPEPYTAQYYSGKLNFLDDLLIELSAQFKVTVLSRDKNQHNHYSQERFEKINLPSQTLDFDDVAVDCFLFIGAGGSMTREMAIIGIPTISVYQGDLLDVDSFLIENHYMVHRPTLDMSSIQEYLNSESSFDKKESLLKKGKSAYQLFRDQLLN